MKNHKYRVRFRLALQEVQTMDFESLDEAKLWAKDFREMEGLEFPSIKYIKIQELRDGRWRNVE